MRRILTVGLLAVGGALATSGAAAADVGDIQELTLDGQMFGSASDVTVTGTIDCQATVEYGLWAGVAQNQAGGSPDDTFFHDNTLVATDNAADAEGVGAFGPNFEPPVGVSDDSPCSQAVSGYDVIVQQNRDSGDFLDDEDLEVSVAVGTSAENGDRGPGPFLGDILGLSGSINFNRTR